MGVFVGVRNHVANGNHGGGGSIRGEEMMMGLERKLLEDVVWGDQQPDTELNSTRKGVVGYDILLERGDILFIPKGWWHSIRGVGEQITASVCSSFLF